MQRARTSRRSACDRCRDFKLRCERPAPGADSCERCAKNNAVCVTTLGSSASSDQLDQQQQQQPQQRSLQPPRWDPVLGSLDPSSLQRPGDNAADSASLNTNGATPWNQHSSSMSSPLANLHNGYAGTACTVGTDINSIDSGIDFDMAMVDFSFPAQAPAGSGRSKQQELTSPTSMGPSVFEELVNFHDRTDGYAVSFSEPNGRGTPRSSSVNSSATASLKDLSALNISLLEDFDGMSKTYANAESPVSFPAMETAIRCTLNRTSRLSEIFKEIAASETSSNGAGSPGRNLGMAHPGKNGSTSLNQGIAEGPASARQARSQPNFDGGRQNQDVLLMTTLVTTFILLTQNWRRTLSHLNHLVMTMPAEKVARLAPVLPTLQLGEFHFRASACVQIGALLDLVAANLEMFEAYLGIDSGDPPETSNAGAGRVKRLVISNDPVSIAIRETLLSQERLSTVSKSGSNEPSLKELINQISGYLFIHMKSYKC